MDNFTNFLLVDDDAFVRMAIAKLLEKNFTNSHVLTANSINDALFQIDENKCDLILLDLSLGKESGITIIKQLRLSKITTPILVLSSLREEEAALDSMKAGADGFLCKDYAIETDKLGTAVKALLAGGKYLSETLAQKLRVPEDNENILNKLSEQEAQVFLLLAKGNSVKEIAHLMDVHEKTVRTYRFRLLEKLMLKSDAEIVRFAIKNEIIA